MENLIYLLTCIFEIIIFTLFFKDILEIRYSKSYINIIIYLFAFFCIFWINLFSNPQLNFLVSSITYLLILIFLFEGELKKKIFYYLIFYTVFAGIELIIEFVLSLILGNSYAWEAQPLLLKFIIICIEKLVTYIVLFFIKKHLGRRQYELKNKLVLFSLILPIATFGIYSALLYSELMVQLSYRNELGLVMGCTLLLLSNIVIFGLYDYIFVLHQEKQALEMLSLKTEMEKKYYDRMEDVNDKQAHYMHDLRFLLKTIGDLAVQEQSDDIKSVLSDMKIRIDKIEEDLFCRHKILNTILCEKKREAIDCNVKYSVYVEPSANLKFLHDMDLIIIMGNIIDNAIEASKKVENGFVDIQIFSTQRDHFLVIRVENKFDGVLKKSGETYCSTKIKSEKHGMGIANVKSCIKKYGGFLQITVDEDIFSASVIFTIL